MGADAVADTTHVLWGRFAAHRHAPRRRQLDVGAVAETRQGVSATDSPAAVKIVNALFSARADWSDLRVSSRGTESPARRP